MATIADVVGRVLIDGVTGSGKSTLARKIAEKTGLPWHSVDDLTWEPGWVVVPRDEQRRRIAAICAGERWILDAGYSSWVDVVLARVELIVALDYPRWRSLGRLTRRTLARAIDRRTICNGNTESFRQMMSRARSWCGTSARSRVSARGCTSGRPTRLDRWSFG